MSLYTPRADHLLYIQLSRYYIRFLKPDRFDDIQIQLPKALKYLSLKRSFPILNIVVFVLRFKIDCTLIVYQVLYEIKTSFNTDPDEVQFIQRYLFLSIVLRCVVIKGKYKTVHFPRSCLA